MRAIDGAPLRRGPRSFSRHVKLATWNVNSLKVRQPHLLDWLSQHAVDIVCLQETKLTDDKFPAAALEEAGYLSIFAGQKTYNGVAVLRRKASTREATDVQVNLPNFEDEQKRLLAVTIDGVRVVCVYVPNGQAVGTDKYDYKLRWLAACRAWLMDEMSRHPRLLIAGDYNVAPEPRDVHDPAAWEGQVLFSEPERAAFRAFLDLGLQDSFRLFDQPERSYTLVGLPQPRVPPQDGPAHRPHSRQQPARDAVQRLRHRRRTTPPRAAERSRAGGRDLRLARRAPGRLLPGRSVPGPLLRLLVERAALAKRRDDLLLEPAIEAIRDVAAAARKPEPQAGFGEDPGSQALDAEHRILARDRPDARDVARLAFVAQYVEHVIDGDPQLRHREPDADLAAVELVVVAVISMVRLVTEPRRHTHPGPPDQPHAPRRPERREQHDSDRPMLTCLELAQTQRAANERPRGEEHPAPAQRARVGIAGEAARSG